MKSGSKLETRNSKLLLPACVLLAACTCFAADLKIPENAIANTAITIGTSGEGAGELYIIGPTARIKREVRLGDDVQLKPEEIQAAGIYTAILRGGGGAEKTFVVAPGPPAAINFLAQPSRVAASTRDAISGTVFLADRNGNLILAPTQVRFQLSIEDAATLEHTVGTRYGVAWTRMDSGRRAGNAQFTASTGGVSVRRVIQQVASEPCNISFHAHPEKQGIVVETSPLRDCAGNPVTDGTIVTFTDVDPRGKSTVDAVVKKGVARAELPASSDAVISAASGVVGGNELHWHGGAE